MSFKVDYTDKYLKYKKKYLSLKNMIGGSSAKRHYERASIVNVDGMAPIRQPDSRQPDIRQPAIRQPAVGRPAMSEAQIADLNVRLEELRSNMPEYKKKQKQEDSSSDNLFTRFKKFFNLED